MKVHFSYTACFNIQDLSEGTGKVAKAGMHCRMVYTGRLASNNKVFDSCTKGNPFGFRLGKGEVIKGTLAVAVAEVQAGTWVSRA